MKDQEFRDNYKSAVQQVAKSKDMTVAQVGKKMAMKNVNNLYTMLKKGYPDGILKAIKPFEVMGATVKIEVNLDNGKKIVVQ